MVNDTYKITVNYKNLKSKSFQNKFPNSTLALKNALSMYKFLDNENDVATRKNCNFYSGGSEIIENISEIILENISKNKKCIFQIINNKLKLSRKNMMDGGNEADNTINEAENTIQNIIRPLIEESIFGGKENDIHQPLTNKINPPNDDNNKTPQSIQFPEIKQDNFPSNAEDFPEINTGPLTLNTNREILDKNNNSSQSPISPNSENKIIEENSHHNIRELFNIQYKFSGKEGKINDDLIKNVQTSLDNMRSTLESNMLELNASDIQKKKDIEQISKLVTELNKNINDSSLKYGSSYSNSNNVNPDYMFLKADEYLDNEIKKIDHKNINNYETMGVTNHDNFNILSNDNNDNLKNNLMKQEQYLDLQRMYQDKKNYEDKCIIL